MSEWMPIETAPKDGTSVLLWVPIAGEPLKGSSIPISARMVISEWLDVIYEWDSPIIYGDDQPTHWARLPSPPEGAQ